LIALANGVAGCAAAHPKVTRADNSTERTAIIYGIGAAPTVPLPLVRGSIAGNPTLMVVDTGTGATVIAAWFARSLELPTTHAQSTHDPSGRAVAMDRCDVPNLRIDGFGPLPDRPTPVVELPPSFEKARIGAIVSPQALASVDTTIVLDLPRGEMRRVRAHDAVTNDVEPGAFEMEHPVLCVTDGAGFDNRRLVATALIDGTPATLEVDTGAIGHPFFVLADTDAGKKLFARSDNVRESGVSAAGNFDVVSARDVPVRVGDQERRVGVTILPGKRDAHCGVVGRLGLDWLRACIFTIGEREYRLRCETSRLPGRP
jgi:hypothetical protein